MSDDDNNNHGSDNETEIDPRAHKRLLAGINSLRTTQFIKKPTRSEPSSKRDEFHLIKPSTTDPAKPDKIRKKTEVDIDELAKVFDKTSKQLQLGKAIRKTADKKKILPKPLEKPASDKLQRVINYEKAVDKLGRWDALVARNQSTDHMVKTTLFFFDNLFNCNNFAYFLWTVRHFH